MTAEEIIRLAGIDLAPFVKALQANKIRWTRLQSPKGSTSYSGAGEGFTATVIKVHSSDIVDGAVVCPGGTFGIIRFPPDLAAQVYANAAKPTETPKCRTCRHMRDRTPKDKITEAGHIDDQQWCQKVDMPVQPEMCRCGGDDYEAKT